MKYTLKKVPGKNEWKCPHCDKVWSTPVHNPATRMPRPLDPNCVEVANAEVTQCPNLTVSGTGAGRKIKWNQGRGDQKDYPCRRRWMDAYLECKNEIPIPPIKPGCVQPCCTQKTGTLIVTVLDDKGAPLENAGIYFWDLGSEGETDKKGQARFSGLKEKKRYVLRAWKDDTEIDGYTYVWPEETSQSPEIVACKEVNHTVRLAGKYMPGKLEVLVLDDLKKPLHKATVTLKPDIFKPSNIELRKSKNSDRDTEPAGLAYYYNLRIGEYWVQAFYEEGKSEKKSVRINNAGWHKANLQIDFENPEKKRFSILIERASWVVGTKGVAGALLVSAVFKIRDSGCSARYEIKNAALGVFSVPFPIGGGHSTMDGDAVTFEALKYYKGRELSVNDFAGTINLKYQGAGAGPFSIWDANFDLEFIGHPNPSIKSRLMRKNGTAGWLKVDNVKPGEVKSAPGLDLGSGANIPFVPKKTL
jgi:hypothetical protein